MNRLLSIGVLIISMMPLSALGQQPEMVRVKADAQKVVSVIRSDQAKTRAYCRMRDLGEQIDQAVREEDRKKTEAMIQKINDLEKQLGPEYLALIDALNDADPNSKDVQDILSMFDRLDEESCTH
jgi:predicted transcriptional regulator